MALTTKKTLDLEDHEFDVCYEGDKEHWRAIVLDADKYGQLSTPEPFHEDLTHLVSSRLTTDTVFRNFMSKATLSADKWYQWFAEYIVEKEWDAVLKAREKLKESKHDRTGPGSNKESGNGVRLQRP